MEFIQSLPTDVKVLFAGGVLVLLFGLFTGSKRTEQRCMVVFTLLMVTAGVRFYMEGRVDQGQAHVPLKESKEVRAPLKSTHDRAGLPAAGTR
jgi:hypothetical protein